MHGVLTADLVGKGRHLELAFHSAYHIQVGHARFDHDHVGTFGNVHGHFVQRFIAVGRVHLIGALVRFAQIGG